MASLMPRPDRASAFASPLASGGNMGAAGAANSGKHGGGPRRRELTVLPPMQQGTKLAENLSPMPEGRWAMAVKQADDVVGAAGGSARLAGPVAGAGAAADTGPRPGKRLQRRARSEPAVGLATLPPSNQSAGNALATTPSIESLPMSASESSPSPVPDRRRGGERGSPQLPRPETNASPSPPPISPERSLLGPLPSWVVAGTAEGDRELKRRAEKALILRRAAWERKRKARLHQEEYSRQLSMTRLGRIREKAAMQDNTVHKTVFVSKYSIPMWQACLYHDHAMRRAVEAIDFRSDEASDMSIQRVLEFSSHGQPFIATLRSLKLDGCQRVSEPVLNQVGVCNNLTSLQMLGVVALSDSTLSGVSRKLLNLQLLRVSKCQNLSPDTIQSLTLTAWRKLHTLGLAYCSGVTDMTLTAVARNKNLTSIDLSGCSSMTDTGVLSLIKGCKQLRTLKLAACSSIKGDVALSALMPDKPKDNRPEYAKRKNSNASEAASTIDDGASVASGSMTPGRPGSPPKRKPKFSSLTCIDMSGVQLTDAGLGWIGAACSHLLELRLQCCFKISGEGLALVGMGCERLQKLYLNNCEQLGDLDIAQFARAAATKADAIATAIQQKADEARKMVEEAERMRLARLAAEEAAAAGEALLEERRTHKKRAAGAPTLKLSPIKGQNTMGGHGTLGSTLMGTTMMGSTTPSAVVATTPRSRNKGPGDSLGVVVKEKLLAPASVTALYLSGCHQLTDRGIREVAKRCRALQVLHLNGLNKISDSSMFALARYCTQLSELSVASQLNFNPSNRDKPAAPQAISDMPLAFLDPANPDDVTDTGEPQTMAAANLEDDTPWAELPSDSDSDEVPIDPQASPAARRRSSAAMDEANMAAPIRHYRQNVFFGVPKITGHGVAAVIRAADSLCTVNLSQCTGLTAEGVIEMVKAAKHAYKRKYPPPPPPPPPPKPVTDAGDADETKSTAGDNGQADETRSVASASSAGSRSTRVNLSNILGAMGASSMKTTLRAADEDSTPKPLQKLLLAGCPLTDSALRRLAQWPHLHELVIARCDDITDSGVESLAAGCTALRTLSLSYCHGVGDRGARAIGRFCPFLKKLYMVACWDVHDDAIYDIAGGCRDLQLVQLDKCYSISKGRVAAMSKRLPMTCVARNYHGLAPLSDMVIAHVKRARRQQLAATMIQRQVRIYAMKKKSWEERAAAAKRETARREAAAIEIQRIGRGMLGRLMLKRLKAEFAANMHLRLDRAARQIQRMARGVIARRLVWRMRKADGHRRGRCFRAWKTYALAHNAERKRFAATELQRLGRGVMCRQKWAREMTANRIMNRLKYRGALSLQRLYRGHRGRKRALHLKVMAGVIAAVKYKAARGLQRVCRGFQARRRRTLEQELHDMQVARRQASAHLIARAWHAYFAQITGLRRLRYIRACAIKIEAMARRVAARRRLRTQFFDMYYTRSIPVCVLLPGNMFTYELAKQVTDMRNRRDRAARKFQRLVKLHLWKIHLHEHYLARLALYKLWRENATKIQAIYRMHWAIRLRKWYKWELQCTINLQRTARGFLGRRRFKRIKWHTGVARGEEFRSRESHWFKYHWFMREMGAAAVIARWWRATVGPRLYIRAMHWLRYRSARCIQKGYRRYKAEKWMMFSVQRVRWAVRVLQRLCKHWRLRKMCLDTVRVVRIRAMRNNRTVKQVGHTLLKVRERTEKAIKRENETAPILQHAWVKYRKNRMLRLALEITKAKEDKRHQARFAKVDMSEWGASNIRALLPRLHVLVWSYYPDPDHQDAPGVPRPEVLDVPVSHELLPLPPEDGISGFKFGPKVLADDGALLTKKDQHIRKLIRDLVAERTLVMYKVIRARQERKHLLRMQPLLLKNRDVAVRKRDNAEEGIEKFRNLVAMRSQDIVFVKSKHKLVQEERQRLEGIIKEFKEAAIQSLKRNRGVIDKADMKRLTKNILMKTMIQPAKAMSEQSRLEAALDELANNRSRR